MKHQNVSWQNDIIAMAGYWEPVSHIIRNGPSSKTIADETYPYSEEIARNLADTGINLVIWHYFKGLGLPHEEEEMARTAEFFKILGRYEIGKGVYVNVGSIYADAFLPAHPEAEKWLTKDIYGKAHVYSEYYRRYFRFRPCHSNPQYGEYLAAAAVKAIRDAGAEFFSLDNCAQMPCYCDNCRKGFPEYVLLKYPPVSSVDKPSFKERFGYSYGGRFELPRGNARFPIDNLPNANEPGLYEWIRYRQNLFESTYVRVSDAIRKVSPKAKICWNMALDNGMFNHLIWGLDPEIAYRRKSDFFFSEDGNVAGMNDGRLISHIRTYKYARAMGNVTMVHNNELPSKEAQLLNYAEAAVFNNGCLGHVAKATDDLSRLDVLKKSLAFFRANRECYINTTPLSQVALFRCSESEIITWADSQVARFAVEQTLLLGSIQYDHIINDRLEDVFNYPLLVCAGTSCVSDRAVDIIARYVRSGGRVLCTGPAFLRDELGRKRISDFETSPLVGETDDNFGSTFDRTSISTILKCLDLEEEYRGNIFWLPELRYVKSFKWDPTATAFPMIDNKYFNEPENVAELVDLLGLALPERNIEFDAPKNIIAGFFKLDDARRVIHILDYETGRTASNVLVKFECSGNVTSAVFKTLDAETEVALQKQGRQFICKLPSFKTYGFLKIVCK